MGFSHHDAEPHHSNTIPLKLLLLLTVIISRAVPSPISQVGPVDSFDIALPDFSDSGINAPDTSLTFHLASSETSPQEAPAQAPQNIPQPGDPVLKPAAQPKPEEAPPVSSKQPFSCQEGKSGACCVGGTRDGETSGCISYTPWDDWCQNQDAYKCCDAEPEKDAAIAAGTLVDDLLRVNCEDPKEVEWSTQKKFQNFGNNLLRIITPQIDTGVSFPKPVWVPNQ